MSKRPLTVLVLGAGGNVSQGIMKALARSSIKCRVLAACINPRSMGLYLADTAFISPEAADPSFFEWLVMTCQREEVGCVLSGTEAVLNVLSQKKEELKEKTGAICVVSDPSQFMVGYDKLATYNWLESNGFPTLPFAPTGDSEKLAALVKENGYPLIAKPRVGRGSEGIVFLGNDDILQFVSKLQDYVVQKRVGSTLSEYTAGTFSDEDGNVLGAIVMQRELTNGTTTWAEVGEFPKIRDQVTAIAGALKPRGPCNMQFRLTEKEAYCFEINVRFSGTTPIRARFGFNEVEAAVRHFVLRETPRELPRVTDGLAFRYWNELYAGKDEFSLLGETGIRRNQIANQVSVEDWGMGTPETEG